MGKVEKHTQAKQVFPVSSNSMVQLCNMTDLLFFSEESQFYGKFL